METKPSIYTSEFWLHFLLQIFLLLNTSHAWTYMPAKWSGIAQSIILTGYMLSRGWAKSKGSFDPALAANYKLIPRPADMNKRIPAR